MLEILVDVLCFIAIVGLSSAYFYQIVQIREMKKTINDNFKHVKKDIMLLDRRTKDLPDEKKAMHRIMPLPIIGE